MTLKKLGLFLSIILFIWGCSGKDSSKNHFEKLVFHTSGCYGTCPIYSLEVDKYANIRLQAIWVAQYPDSFNLDQSDTSRVGYFVGKVADTTFTKLNHEILNTNINEVTIDGPACCDGSVQEIILYCNHKRKYMKSMGSWGNLEKLVDILYEICQTPGLVRIQQKFEIERNEKPK